MPPISLPRDSPAGRKDMSRVDGWTPLVRTGSMPSSALCGADTVQDSGRWPGPARGGRSLCVALLVGVPKNKRYLLNTRGHTLKVGASGPNRKSDCGFTVWR